MDPMVPNLLHVLLVGVQMVYQKTRETEQRRMTWDVSG